MANGFKTGGRKLGTPNKRQKIGKRIDAFIDNEWDNISLYIEDMSDKEKVDFILKLLPYATPKYSYKSYEEDVLDSPLFHDIQIVTTTDEKTKNG